MDLQCSMSVSLVARYMELNYRELALLVALSGGEESTWRLDRGQLNR